MKCRHLSIAFVYELLACGSGLGPPLSFFQPRATLYRRLARRGEEGEIAERSSSRKEAKNELERSIRIFRNSYK